MTRFIKTIPSCNQSMSRGTRREGRKRIFDTCAPMIPQHDNLTQKLRLGIALLLFFSITHATNAAANAVDTSNYPELSQAKHAMLIDQDTKEILFARNIDDRLAPSSMTKLMTAYVIFDQIKKGKINFDTKCAVGKDAWRKSGSTMFLNYGDVVTIDELITGLLVVSGNDAAIALAVATSGSVDDFADLMNKKAAEIGLTNSHFKNPHGLNQDGHYMSIRDLSSLAIKIAEDFPEHRTHYFSITEFTYKNITQINRNPLIKKNYEGATGMKTGHTDKGGYGVVGTATRGNRRLIAVVNEARTPSQRERLVTEMLDYGFDNYKKVELFDKDRSVAKLQTWLGSKDAIEVASNKNIAFTIPKDQSAEDIKVSVKYQEPIYAPVVEGRKLATLVIETPDHQKREVSLFAKENVDKAGYIKRIWKIAEYKCSRFITEVLHNNQNTQQYGYTKPNAPSARDAAQNAKSTRRAG